jgi:cytochrome c-type biogenesis protein CcmH
MIAAGKTDDEIRAYMTDRYGDFVLYRPPFNATTALLWIAPGVLVVGGLGMLVVMLRRRRSAPEATGPGERESREIEALLSDAPPPKAEGRR